ncbi:MAG: electron transfer flavoprotein subunit alpha/FixB family protein [Lentisphaeria bacterium]|jgi:electron transfer flavoprotein alpha subunit|nr:electron transfer flavoprotein subunit alpha/FixB family protein [Lentisphaeria bacterium]
MGTTTDGIWVLAEQEAGALLPVAFELLARGRKLADAAAAELVAVVLGESLAADELQRLIRAGADTVLAVESPALAHFLVEPYAACLARLVRERDPAVFLAAATSTGRTAMPYLAALVHTGLTADCTELDIDAETGQLLQTRPAIGGNILATIRTPDHRPQMATVRPHSGPRASEVPGRKGRIERLSPESGDLSSRMRRVGFTPAADAVSLADAERVVVTGRGLRKAENLPLVQELAAVLGAAVGGTRDVVDRGWLEYPHQIGLSGKTISPRLYVGAGVSGAIQHLAGMQTSEHIVAVNSDPDAQIFRLAELGVVGDMHEVLPVLTRKLRARAGQGRAEA